MTKAQTNILIVLLACVLAVLAYLAFIDSRGTPSASAPALASATDAREAVLFNSEQHQFALQQMRGLLVAIKDLDAAELAGDTNKMAAIARAEGPGQAKAHPEGFHEALPDGFRSMSQAMRKTFGSMVADLESGDMKAYHTKKQDVLGVCVTCHESYRFQSPDAK